MTSLSYKYTLFFLGKAMGTVLFAFFDVFYLKG